MAQALKSNAMALSLCLVLPICLSGRQKPPQTTDNSCREFVAEFYSWYIAKTSEDHEPDGGVALKYRSDSFSPAVVQALREDSEAQTKAGSDLVSLDGDPFLGADGLAGNYIVEKVTVNSRSCRAEVHSVWDGKEDQTPYVIPELKITNRGWRFVDFYFPTPSNPRGWSLLSNLKALRQGQKQKGIAPGGKQTSTRSSKPFTLAQVWKLDAVYRDTEHGVTFRYPSVWVKDTHLAYVPPALSRPADVKPIAGFAYEMQGFESHQNVRPYSRTNLEGFGIAYSVIARGSSAECKAFAASLSETHRSHTAALAGRSFWVYETSDAAMMQGTEGKLYATYTNHMCYLFETDVASVSTGAMEDVRELTSAESRSIDLHLSNIMKSVRIVSR